MFVVRQEEHIRSTIVERIDAGESQEAVAADYGLNNDDVEEAVLYRSAA